MLLVKNREQLCYCTVAYVRTHHTVLFRDKHTSRAPVQPDFRVQTEWPQLCLVNVVLSLCVCAKEKNKSMLRIKQE